MRHADNSGVGPDGVTGRSLLQSAAQANNSTATWDDSTTQAGLQLMGGNGPTELVVDSGSQQVATISSHTLPLEPSR